MAVANVAWLLAMNGERVLVVDWDLEAPGIHRYFHPLLDDKELLETEGLLDFVEKLSMRAAMSSDPLSEKEVDVIEYVKMLQWPANFPVSWERFGPNAGIDLLIAGRQGPLYGTRLNAFSFVDFYEKLGGRRLLAMARKQMRSLYDYVLIDSRTGVSDTSGICTVEMPDTLAVCFTLNDQSIIGASGVAHDVLEQNKKLTEEGKSLPKIPSGGAGVVTSGQASSSESPGPPEVKFRIFPVPTRVELNGEQAKLQIALALARKKFAPFLAEHLARDEWSRYWGSVQMAYFTAYAFEEIPAVFGDPIHQQISLLASMKEIARAVTGDDSLRPVGLADDDERAEGLRKEVLGWYLRKADAEIVDPVSVAQSTLDHARDQLLMRRVLLRLVQAGGSTPVAIVAEMSDFDEGQMAMARSLAEAGILLISGNSVSIADRRVVERWDRLGQWLKEDEAFLTWRQPFSVAARAWRASAKEASQLLRGKSLRQATEWLGKRAEDFNGTESDFVLASRRKNRRNLAVGSVAIGAVMVAMGFLGNKLLEAGKRFFAPAGQYWTDQTSGKTLTLFSVFGTSDGRRVWVVGDLGTILESSDDGAHWGEQVSRAGALFSGFATSDGKRAWAVGFRGTIVDSSDGEHWAMRASGTQYSLFSVFGTSDGKRAWVVGDKGTILESTDGEHWIPRASGTNVVLGSVFGTSDGKRLLAVGEGGTILESRGGERWDPRTSGTTEYLSSIFGTSDGKRLWVVGASGTILESSDGEHWDQVTSGTTSFLTSVFGTSDGKHLYVTGREGFRDGFVLESSDGKHWNTITKDTQGFWSIFGTSDGRRLWVIGGEGTIRESHGR
jgi:photosystem II stability/assembly factor-like uncharacterized protein